MTGMKRSMDSAMVALMLCRANDSLAAVKMDTLSVDVGYPGLRGGEVSVINAADCSESPVTAVRMSLTPADGAW